MQANVLIDPDRLPNRAMTDAETLLKRRTFAVERAAVLRLQALYRDAFRDLRDTLEGAPNRAVMTGMVNSRLERLKGDVLAVVERASKAALVGNYYGRLWLLDMATGEDVRVNVPVLTPDRLREDLYDDLIRDLMGKQWRAQYEVELDDLVVGVRRAIGNGLANGEGMSAIQRRVRDAMGVQTDRRKGYRANFNRVQAITRTVVQTVSNNGAVAAYKANDDVLKGYEWLTTNDERTCIDCQRMNGRVFTFKSHVRPPKHINCRCTVIPVAYKDAIENDTRKPRQSLDDWSKGYGLEREMADFMGAQYRAPVVKPVAAPKAPTPAPGSTEVTTLDGTFKRDVGTPGNTNESLNKFLNDSQGPLASAIADQNVGMVSIDYSGDVDAFTINREAVRREALAFVKESQNIQYSRDYLLSIARDHALENGVQLEGQALETAFNRQYATRAEAIRTLANIDGLKLTEAQARRLQSAIDGNYLDMVYAREGSDTGSLYNAATARGGQRLTGGALREARKNFQDWVLGLDT